MVVRTRVILGCRETPRFVSESFFDAVKCLSRAYQFEDRMFPTSINYHIPNHMVVERLYSNIDFYDILLDDTVGVPRCRRTRTIYKKVYKRNVVSNSFDRFQVHIEDHKTGYYLMTPDVMFHAVEIFTDWSCSSILINGVVWYVHFRKVFVDPYDTSNTIWFHTKPKFQIEIVSHQNMTGRDQELKRVIASLIPRSFRWE